MDWLALWVCCAVFAHVFAAVWLIRAFIRPGQLNSIKGKVKGACAGAAPKSLEPCENRQAAANPPHAIIQPIASRHKADKAPALGLSWYGVSCSYPTADKRKHYVLQDSLGCVGPGRLGVLLGPSGSGKSTLLEVLAGRKAVGTLEGHIAMTMGGSTRQKVHPSNTGSTAAAQWRDVDAHRSHVLKHSSFVPQEDGFPASLTAAELLTFWAAMVIPSSSMQTHEPTGTDPHPDQQGEPVSPTAVRKTAVYNALAAMGLLGQQDTLVGGQLPGGLQVRGLSGGERKRLAVAAGCLPAPQLLLLDEPTTGLDSAAALKVMSHLRAMAAGPSGSHTVLASIHQPRAAMWDLVDVAVVLSCGRTMYAGPPSKMVGWLSGTLGYAYSPVRHGSAPDWAMDLVNIGFKKPKRFYNGRTLETAEELHKAAERFMSHYTEHHGKVKVARKRTCEASSQAPLPGIAAAGGLASVPEAGVLQQDGRREEASELSTTLRDLAPEQPMPTRMPGSCEIQHFSQPHHTQPLQQYTCEHPDQPLFESDGNDGDAAADACVLPPFLLPHNSCGVHTSVEAIAAVPASTAASSPYTWDSLTPYPVSCTAHQHVLSQAMQPVNCTDMESARTTISCPPSCQQHEQPPAGPLPLTSSPAEGKGAAAAVGKGHVHLPMLNCPPGSDLSSSASFHSLDNATHPLEDLSPAFHTTPGEAGGHQEPTQREGCTRKGVERGDLWLGEGSKGEAAARMHEPGSGGKGTGPQAAQVGWMMQVWTICWRELALSTRNPADVAGRTLVFVWSGLIMGAVFYSLAINVHGLQSRLSLMFAEGSLFFLLPFCYISLFTSDKRLYIADVSARLYSPFSYHVAKTLVMLPFAIVNVVLFCGTVYGMVGLRGDLQGLPVVQHMLVALIAYLLAQQVLYCSAMLTPNQDIAFLLAIAWMAINILLANFPLRTTEYEMTWVTPLRYLSALHFMFGGLMRAEFANGQDYSCAEGLGDRIVNVLPNYLPDVQALTLPAVQRILGSPGPDCQINPEAILSFFSITWPWYSYVGALLVYLSVLHFLSFGALLFARKQERR